MSCLIKSQCTLHVFCIIIEAVFETAENAGCAALDHSNVCSFVSL
jgi:hypothetical protein